MSEQPDATSGAPAGTPVSDAGFDAPQAASGPDAPLLRRTRRRLVAWSAGTMLAVLVLLGVGIYAAVAGSLAATSRDQLQQRVSSMLGFIANVPDPFPDRPNGQPDVSISFGGRAPGTIALMVTPSGRVIGPQSRVAGLPDDAGLKAALAGSTDVRTASVNGTPIRILSVPVQRTNGTVVVQVAQDISAEQGALGTLVVGLVLGGLAAVIAAVIGGQIYAGRALIPIRDSLRRQREFAADASHELRTPLTVIRATVEHFERHPELKLGDETEALGDVRAEVDHLTSLVGDLLLLARTDSGVEELAPEAIDASEVASEAVDGMRTVAADRHVTLELQATPTPLDADRTRLRQLVGILIDNAIRHGPAGGTVRIAVAPRERGGATLTVDDQGPGIRPEDRSHVFDRFWRAPGASAGGTGLGLAIAAWVVERHGGTIDVADAPGGGARFEVRLPAHPPS